jgi:REP element-mobilizing transposase RayT
LSGAHRQTVTQAIHEPCTYRGWSLLAINVRSNHVHVVVEANGQKPERIPLQLKAWSTRRLRESGDFPSNRKIWTYHGSTRYLWNERSLSAAVTYVEDYQEGMK